MPLLNTADAVYLGSNGADRVYLGDELVWDSTPPVSQSYNLFPGPTPQIPITDDVGPLSLSTEFYVTSAASVTKLRYLYPTNGWTVNQEMAIYEYGNLNPVYGPIAMGGSSSYQGTWVEYTLPTPFALTPNTNYYVTTFWPGGMYAAVSHYFDTGVGQDTLIQGPLVRPNNADSIEGQGRYQYSGSISYPSGTFGAASYFTDVEVTT